MLGKALFCSALRLWMIMDGNDDVNKWYWWVNGWLHFHQKSHGQDDAWKIKRFIIPHEIFKGLVRKKEGLKDALLVRPAPCPSLRPGGTMSAKERWDFRIPPQVANTRIKVVMLHRGPYSQTHSALTTTVHKHHQRDKSGSHECFSRTFMAGIKVKPSL